MRTLVRDPASPFNIALDLAGGKMYWTTGADVSPSYVRRANLDGTGEETLVVAERTKNTAGPALDLAHGKIYYTDQFGGDILRANLDGTDQEPLVNGLSSPIDIALAIEPVPELPTLLVLGIGTLSLIGWRCRRAPLATAACPPDADDAAFTVLAPSPIPAFRPPT